MKKYRILIIEFSVLLSLFLISLFSCTKETIVTEDNNEQENISEIPAIILLEVAPLSVVQYQDSILFSISYIDGDGDLGDDDPDATVVELVDNRNPEDFIFNYHLSPRAPTGSAIAIEGTLDIILDNTILQNQNNEQESTTFSIRIQDRKGHWSNTIETGEIVISK